MPFAIAICHCHLPFSKYLLAIFHSPLISLGADCGTHFGEMFLLGLSLRHAEEVLDQRERFRNATKFLNLVGYVSLQWWWKKFGIISTCYPFGQNIWDGMRSLLSEWNARHPTRAVQLDNWKLGWFYPPGEWSQANARNRLSDYDVQACRRAYAYAYPTFFNYQTITDSTEVEMKCVWILIVGMQRSWWVHSSRVR